MANANEQAVLQAGDKVTTLYGEVRTVESVRGCQVFVKEESNRWYHPSKVTKVATDGGGR